MQKIRLELHHHGDWHSAAQCAIEDAAAGTKSIARVDYDLDYVVNWDAIGLKDADPAIDFRALSVRYPTDFASTRTPTWPPFLLDLMPQGHARRRIAKKLGFDNANDPAVELPLLLRGGSSPIGNMRIREAWDDERNRLADQTFKGLHDDDVMGQSERFVDTVDRFALIASGSSGVQGDWPKVLLTKAKDGLWYPDPLVIDADADQHTIVKLLRDKDEAYADILAAEAPYLEVAREFGLRVGKPLTHSKRILIIPRFDRETRDGTVIRHGQESLISALGVAEFGHLAYHEDYLALISEVATDPRAEIIEYVLRDLLNFAMGNPDNHGRNTALQKRDDGWIGLTPLFDFTPMRLDPTMVARSTRWRCLNGKDADPDWKVITDAVGNDAVSAEELISALKAKSNALRALHDIARESGLAEKTFQAACGRYLDAAKGIEDL